MKEFLDIRGIQRKYPDWKRRALEVEEREFLVGMSVVSETLSNMGEVGDAEGRRRVSVYCMEAQLMQTKCLSIYIGAGLLYK